MKSKYYNYLYIILVMFKRAKQACLSIIFEFIRVFQ